MDHATVSPKDGADVLPAAAVGRAPASMIAGRSAKTIFRRIRRNAVD
ncbi:hypothetical protein I546_4636 [Mycobacterium kansasii 732]|nr:hypothetical protein I546_4636 [Mycobacterium kansasii 732]